MNNHQFVVRFLYSFFRPFKAYLTDVSIGKSEVKGIIEYIDEDGKQECNEEDNRQAFIWHLSQYSLIHIERAFQLLDYLYTQELIDNDRILISPHDLSALLSKSMHWDDENVGNAISSLLNIEISMLDDGIETDKFFYHF
jgi:hypothetical protein